MCAPHSELISEYGYLCDWLSIKKYHT